MKITMVTKADGLYVTLEGDTEIDGMPAITLVEKIDTVLKRLVELEILEDVRGDLAKAIGDDTKK